MAKASANGVELDYDTFGAVDAPPLLLIMGLSAQKIAWENAFCQLLADRGFYVIRFDNRDIGLSTKMVGAPRPDLAAAMAGDTSSASYRLEDMADDAAGLLEALAIPAAHIVGVSMGGMIAQALVIHHPDRVRSLCSIMSTTGSRDVGQPTPEAIAMLFGPPAANRDEAMDGAVRASKVIGSPGYPAEEVRLRQRAGEAWDRDHDSAGVARQLLAVMASPDRTPGLAGVVAPTLVIHGEADTLVTLSGGKATAAAVPGAQLLTIPGMGHDLPIALWPRIVDAIVANADRAPANAER